MPTIETNLIPRVLGLADDVARGEAPIAVVNFVQEAVAGAPANLALHVDELHPVASPRAAGEWIEAHGHRAANDAMRGLESTFEFPYAAAIQATDGTWFATTLSLQVDGMPFVYDRPASYVLSEARTTVTRTSDRLRLIAQSGAGFAFRHGVDEVPIRYPNFSAAGFLGDHYTPASVDVHLRRAKEWVDDGRTAFEQVEEAESIVARLRGTKAGDLRGVTTARAQAHNTLVAARSELQRLLPHEVEIVPVDQHLVDEVAASVQRIDDIIQQLSDVNVSGIPYKRESLPALRAQLDPAWAAIEALPAAPTSQSLGSAAEMTEFDILLDRVASGSFLTRAEAVRAFDYSKFGRTSAERLRNVGAAMEALDTGVGFGDGGGHGRLKTWLLGVADDAAVERAALDPSRSELAQFLDRVEDHARRNGQEGPVRNARGEWGYEDYPDYAEIGAMGAALRTYIAVDDAGRLLANAPAPTPGTIIW